MFILALGFALVVALVQGDENTKEESIIDKGKSFLNKAGKTIKDNTDDLTNSANEMADKVGKSLNDGINEASKSIKDFADNKGKELLEDANKKIEKTTDDLTKGTLDIINKATSSSGSILEISNLMLNTVIAIFFVVIMFF